MSEYFDLNMKAIETMRRNGWPDKETLATIEALAWPHDPRTAPLTQPTDEHLAQDGKMVYSTPEREEFSAWLERDDLKEER